MVCSCNHGSIHDPLGPQGCVRKALASKRLGGVGHGQLFVWKEFIGRAHLQGPCWPKFIGSCGIYVFVIDDWKSKLCVNHARKVRQRKWPYPTTSFRLSQDVEIWSVLW